MQFDLPRHSPKFNGSSNPPVLAVILSNRLSTAIQPASVMLMNILRPFKASDESNFDLDGSSSVRRFTTDFFLDPCCLRTIGSAFSSTTTLFPSMSSVMVTYSVASSGLFISGFWWIGGDDGLLIESLWGIKSLLQSSPSGL